MRKLKLLAFALICAVFAPAKADEGMWLLQLMQEQNLADRMKAQGLKIGVDDIYSSESCGFERCRRYFRARMYG